MPAWLQALAGAVVGGVLVAASNYLLFWLQRGATERRELTAVVADFTGVLDQMSHELRHASILRETGPFLSATSWYCRNQPRHLGYFSQGTDSGGARC
jgi:hypothetical protein